MKEKITGVGLVGCFNDALKLKEVYCRKWERGIECSKLFDRLAKNTHTKEPTTIRNIF